MTETQLVLSGIFDLAKDFALPTSERIRIIARIAAKELGKYE